jgi:hypothetical protein
MLPRQVPFFSTLLIVGAGRVQGLSPHGGMTHGTRGTLCSDPGSMRMVA